MEKSKIKNILLTIIIVILTLLSSYLLYDKFLGKGGKVSNNQNILNIYGYDDGYSKDICQGKNTYCNKLIATIEVNNENANIIHIWNNYVLYFDNKMKIYDIDSHEIKELDINISEEEINEFKFSYLNSDYYYLENGFIFSDDNFQKRVYYYDVENNRKLFSEYSSVGNSLRRVEVSQTKQNYKRYIQGIKDGIYYLLDVETGQPVLNRKPDEIDEYVGFEVIQGCGEENDLFSSYLQKKGQSYNYIIYNRDGKIINKLAKDEMYIANHDCELESDIFIYKKDRVYGIDGNLKK